MTPQLEPLIEKLKTAQTVPELARATAGLLQAFGVFNFQAVAYELARMSVTSDGDGFGKSRRS
jgi:hypothetical protein